MYDRETALNIFRPGDAIDDPEVFAGRKRHLLELTDALLVDGTIPIIYGERGLGKTSLALQVARIAGGDVTLLEEHGARSRALRDEQRYTPVWMSCSSDATKTSSDVLQRLINNAELYPIQKPGTERLTAVESKTKLSLKMFESETIRRYSSDAADRYAALHIEDKVMATIDTLIESGHTRLLFIIDEFDRVAATDGLANFLKNASSHRVKFLLVGIGQSISTLLADHESLSRSLVPIMIHPMTTDELDEITKKAVLRINQANLGVTFTVGARQRMIAAGGGFPWFLHVLGQTTLLEALENRRSQIQSAHIESAINDLATHRLAQQLNDRYQLAVGESVQRETVLRLLARWRGTDVPVSEVYPLAQQLGVSNPAAHKATLLKEGYGRVLVQPPKLKGVVRFRDAMFKRFCFLRKSLFTGCDARVNEAWEQAHAIDKP